jgi:putative ABC transport system permease protein
MGNPAFAFAVGLSVISALLFGLAPVAQSFRSDPLRGIQDCGRGDSAATQPRLRSALVIAQTAVAVALAISAALLLQSYARMRTLRTGVRAEGLITASLRLPDNRYGSGPERAKFYDELLRRVQEIPGVRMSAATSALHLQSKGEGSMTWPEGALIDAHHPPIVRNRNVSPDYFRVLGIPLVAGRAFSQADNALSGKVMLVNESFARTYFPAGQAIGRHVTYTSEHATAEIVGVVGDVRPRMIDAAAQPEMYFPSMQRSRHEMTLVVRSSLSLAVLERAMRNELRELDSEQALYDVQTMGEVVSSVLSRPRSTTWMVGCFSLAALVLAAIGIYGVLSFTVSRRSREIGIRMALGAQTTQIRAMVLGQSIKVVAAGIATGIGVSLAAARFSSTLLFGVAPGDPLTILLVAIVVLGVGWLAAFFPARRAARVDPMRALQSE